MLISPSLKSLPPEIYTAILLSLPTPSLQQTVLSLTRALPFSPVPVYHLFNHIHLKHPDQVVQLHRRLREAKSDAAWVRELAVETWTADADVVVNLINILPKVMDLTLFIGPNFTPEHLQEIFEVPMPDLQSISLRFRPYVQRATYYQFLKGAYFDSTLHVLSQWPHSKDKALSSLSIVQDPIDPEVAQKQHFAQPLVFFLLDPFTTLVRSDYLQYLTSFRLRIPGRQFVRFICADPRSLPALNFLDISTCLMLESEVETLLARFTKLRHLILDGCGMKRLNTVDGEWVALGKACSLAGVRRARDREKKLKVWLQATAGRSTLVNSEQTITEGIEMNGQNDARRPRRGRRGLATATISLRESSMNPSFPAVTHLGANTVVTKIRILPPSPSLISLAITISSQIPTERHAGIRADFERGWIEGLTQLSATRSRLHKSRQNGIRLVRFSDEASASEEGLDGLVVVENDEINFRPVGDDRTPVLCLAGPGKEGHVKGCGHAVGWDIWKDEI